ncbi:MAG: hypothetical protein ACI4RD_09675 [Kiritimatiellia bacterium]
MDAVYKFEGTVKSSFEKKIEFVIEPTSKYKVTSSVCGGNVEAYVAFSDSGKRKVVAIDETSLRICDNSVSNRVHHWLCFHSDTGHAMTFSVDKNGILQYPGAKNAPRNAKTK